MHKQLTDVNDDISLGYCHYICLNVVKFLCCCCVRRFDTEQWTGYWFRRNMQKLRKLKLAQDKLEKELEIEDLIN